MPGEQKLTLCGITQQIDPDMWDWTDEEKKALAVGTADAIGQVMLARLDATKMQVTDFYIILHDKDTRKAWDEVTQVEVLDMKPLHVHVVVKFKDRKSGGSLSAVAAAVGLDEQYVEKPGRGRWAFDNMLAYLIHIKYPEKHQYNPAEVATLRGRSYMEIYRERREAWLAGRAQVKKKRAAEGAELLRDRVLTGDITKGQILLSDELFEVYSRNTRLIDDALAAYGQRRSYRAAAKLERGDFSTQVVYLHGESGSGKTQVAHAYINWLKRQDAAVGERWDLYKAATGNSLDDYAGEAIVLLDDVRASAMDANDWLVFLDPKHASPAKARYANKQNVAPRVIIITAIIPPIEFFFWARQKGQVDEALDQFLRRLAWAIRVVNADEIRQYELSRMGRTASYDWVAPSKAVEQCERLRLNFGATETVEAVDVDDVAITLGADLAARSSDLGWDTDAWDKRTEELRIESAQRTPSAQERKARLADAEARARCQAQADGFTACRIQMDGDRAERYMALPDPTTPSGWGVNEGGELDMSLWDFETETYNGQPARRWYEISDEFLSDYEQTVARDRRKELV